MEIRINFLKGGGGGIYRERKYSSLCYKLRIRIDENRNIDEVQKKTLISKEF